MLYFALLKLEGTSFMLSLCEHRSASFSWRGAFTYIWYPFLQLLPRGHSLITWLWGPEACNPGSHGTVTTAQLLAAYNTLPVFRRKRPICPGALALLAGFWSGTLLGPTELPCRRKTDFACSQPCTSLTISPKKLVPLPHALIFAALPGDASTLPGSAVQRDLMLSSPTGL